MVLAGRASNRGQSHGIPLPVIDLAAATGPGAPEPGEETDYEPVTQWDLVKDNVENYLKVFGRPAQVAAWRDGKPCVAELADDSAGR